MPDPDPPSEINSILNRPASERLREYKYRFAQSMVFGLPVIALQYLGPILGGPEAGRWVGMLQTLLAGWVMYVGAMGMLVEGILLKKFTADALVATTAIGLYLFALSGFIPMVLTGQISGAHDVFDWAVIVIVSWTGIQWFRHAKHQSP